ncbi:Alpha/Beta hydrolase protein [Cadophora sp. MPI-SDFR-AT-0126]|nr:Alpha/Beta hydrolase protein [Leotiomycetes sp. MPI-SDFR-AT-0126]
MAIHPDPYVRLPTAGHKTTLIILHGTSQTGPKFAEAFLPTRFSPPPPPTPPPSDRLATSSASHVSHEKVSLPEYFPSCKFVFPTGAPRRTTVFGGRETNAWFDITDFGDRTKGEMNMIEGMRDSSLYLADLVRKEIEALNGEGEKGNGSNGNVVIAGFSQGSAMCSMLLLGGELQRQGLVGHLGAFIGLSGWLPFRRQIEGIISRESQKLSDGDGAAAVRDATTIYIRGLLGLDDVDGEWKPNAETCRVPIFLGHGELDVKMRFEWGEQLSGALKQLGMEVHFKLYAGLEHWWGEQEMTDVAEFLDQKSHVEGEFV